MLLSLDNLNKVDVHFEWNLIDKDPDDNKYVDAAIVGLADFIVTNDQHFKILASIDFPKVSILSIEEFLNMLVKFK
jgi:predicted nucleic acid-binding protein